MQADKIKAWPLDDLLGCNASKACRNGNKAKLEMEASIQSLKFELLLIETSLSCAGVNFRVRARLSLDV